MHINITLDKQAASLFLLWSFGVYKMERIRRKKDERTEKRTFKGVDRFTVNKDNINVLINLQSIIWT